MVNGGITAFFVTISCVARGLQDVLPRLWDYAVSSQKSVISSSLIWYAQFSPVALCLVHCQSVGTLMRVSRGYVHVLQALVMMVVRVSRSSSGVTNLQLIARMRRLVPFVTEQYISFLRKM